MSNRMAWLAAVALSIQSPVASGQVLEPGSPPWNSDGHAPPYAMRAGAPGSSTVEIETGATLARHWCSQCHDVGPSAGDRKAYKGPAFASIARDRQSTPESIDRFLSTVHTQMPDFALSPYERNLLIAYILSLAPQ